MANTRKKVKLTPEGEALRREALSRADDIQAQYEESKRLDPTREKGLYIRHGRPDDVKWQFPGS